MQDAYRTHMSQRAGSVLGLAVGFTVLVGCTRAPTVNRDVPVSDATIEDAAPPTNVGGTEGTALEPPVMMRNCQNLGSLRGSTAYGVWQRDPQGVYTRGSFSLGELIGATGTLRIAFRGRWEDWSNVPVELGVGRNDDPDVASHIVDGYIGRRNLWVRSGYARFQEIPRRGGQPFEGVIENTLVVEVVRNPDTGYLEDVPDGRCLFIPRLEFSAVVSEVAVPDGGTVNPCVGAGDCNACTVNPGCVWCATNNACLMGSSSGPSSGSCSQWRWGTAQCTSAAPDAGGAPGLEEGGLRQTGGPANYAGCTSGANCSTQTAECILANGSSDGVCVAPCSADADCPGGGACVQFSSPSSGTYGRCMQRCAGTTCYSSGFRCYNYRTVAGPGANVCAPNTW